VAALRAAGAQVVISFSIPAFTALLKLNSLKLSFNPQLVVSNVGADPDTLIGLLQSIGKQSTAAASQLINGIVTDGYLPSPATQANSWIQLFQQVHSTYDAKAPFDGNVLYGEAVAYTLSRRCSRPGGTRPEPASRRRSTPGSRRGRCWLRSATPPPTTSVSPAPR